MASSQATQYTLVIDSYEHPQLVIIIVIQNLVSTNIKMECSIIHNVIILNRMFITPQVHDKVILKYNIL